MESPLCSTSKIRLSFCSPLASWLPASRYITSWALNCRHPGIGYTRHLQRQGSLLVAVFEFDWAGTSHRTMAAKTAKTLSSGTLRVPYMPMTVHAIPCPPPILQDDFDGCRIPGGVDLWSKGGFYSPGECFSGYRAMCTQTSAATNGWPIQDGETVVRCVPE